MGKIWGWAFVLGTCALLVWRVLDSFPLAPRQDALFFVLGGVAVGTLLLVRFLPRAREGLCWALVVPLLARVVVMALLAWLVATSLPSQLEDPLVGIRVGVFVMNLTLWLIVAALLQVAYDVWITLLVIDRVDGRRPDPLGRLKDVPRRLGRGFLVLLIGWIPVILLTIGGGALVMDAGAGVAGIVLTGLAVIVLNVLTAPLLLTTLKSDARLGRALGQGFRDGRRAWRAWVLPVTAQALLLGAITFASVSFSTSDVTPGGIRTEERGLWTVVQPYDATHRSHHIQRTNWSFNADWLGGYEDDTAWDDKLAEALDTTTVLVIEFLCMLLLGIVAIAVKLHIASVLFRTGPQPADGPPDPGVRPLLALLLLPLLVGCGEPRARVDRAAALEERFLAVEAGRFHVRGLALMTLLNDRDPHDAAKKALRKQVAGQSRMSALRAFEYVAGGDAVLRLELGDRIGDEDFPLDEATLERDPDDPRMLALEWDVEAGRRIVVVFGTRYVADLERAGDRVVLAVFGGTGDARAWRATPRDLEGAPAYGRGVLVERIVEGSRSMTGNGTTFDMPVPHHGRGGWLAADLGRAFPILRLLRIPRDRFPSGSSSQGHTRRGDTLEVSYRSESLQITGDGVEYRVVAHGVPYDDLTAWPAPCWILRGRFEPR